MRTSADPWRYVKKEPGKDLYQPLAYTIKSRLNAVEQKLLLERTQG